MKISTRGRYGLRLLVDIAEQATEAPIAHTTIAKRQNLSEKYHQQDALLLARGGVLTSVKGSRRIFACKASEEILAYNVLDLV